MATAYKEPSSLRIKLDMGMDLETSKQVYKTRTYQNLKTDADVTDVYEVGQALSNLVEGCEGFEIFKVDVSQIKE